MREHIRKVIACIKAPPDVPQEGMGGRDTGAALPQRTSAYVLDQLLAGGLLGSPRSSLEKSEHARLSTNPQASISSGQRKHPQAPQAAEQALEARPDRAGPPAVLTPADLEDGPTPLMSAFASAPASAEPVFTCPEQPLPRLNVARASTDSALDIPGLLPSAFASVAYADAFNSPRWSSRVEAQREQPAPAVDLQHIELSLPGIPVQHACPCNTQVSITPTLWRHFEPPFRLMVHLGIHTTLVEGEMTLPLGIYSSLNPRVVTTGMPSRRYHPYQRRSSSVGIVTRGAAAASGGGMKLRKSGSFPLMPTEAAPARREKNDFNIMEVLLLKRDVLTREIQEQWHADRPAIDGGTLGDSPVWPGTWVIDVVCRVSDGSEHNIWLKALDRTIAASPEASFINQFTL